MFIYPPQSRRPKTSTFQEDKNGDDDDNDIGGDDDWRLFRGYMDYHIDHVLPNRHKYCKSS